MILDKLIKALDALTPEGSDADLVPVEDLLELALALRPAMSTADAVRCNTGIAIRTVETPTASTEYDVVITMRLDRDSRDELLCFLAAS